MKKQLLPPKEWIGIPVDLQLLPNGRMGCSAGNLFYFDAWGKKQETYVSGSAIEIAQLGGQVRQNHAKFCNLTRTALIKKIQKDDPRFLPCSKDVTDETLRQSDSYADYMHRLYKVLLETRTDRSLAQTMCFKQPVILSDGSIRLSATFPSNTTIDMIRREKPQIDAMVVSHLSHYAAEHTQFAKSMLPIGSYELVNPIFTQDKKLVYTFNPRKEMNVALQEAQTDRNERGEPDL